MDHGHEWFHRWSTLCQHPTLDNLDLADFGRWAKLALLVYHPHRRASFSLAPPARSLCAMLQVPDFNELLRVIRRLPLFVLQAHNGGYQLVLSQPSRQRRESVPSTEPSLHARLRETWQSAWQKRWGLRYPWNGSAGRALKQIIEFLEHNFPDTMEQKGKELLETFLKDSSAFFVRRRHSLMDLASNPQAWIVSTRESPGPFAPSTCHDSI